jgi:hypothetical protein
MVILESIAGKEHIAFGTTTLPDLSNELHYRLVENWAEITRQFVQELTRALKRKGITQLVISVTEIQEKRSIREEKICPHLHLAFPGRKHRYQRWAISKEEFQAIWQRILSNFLGFKVDCKAATNIQKVKHSIKRYLSKYMSKGGEILDKLKDAGLQDYIPRSWFYCTRSLKQAARRSIEKLSPKIAEYIYDNREYLKSVGILSWFHVCTMEFTDYQTGFSITRNVGMVGAFNDSIPIADILKKLNELVCK